MTAISQIEKNEKDISQISERKESLFKILFKSNVFWILAFLLGVEVFLNVYRPLKFVQVQGTMLKDHDVVGARINQILLAKEKECSIVLGDSTGDSICFYPDMKNYNIQLTSISKFNYLKARTGESAIQEALQHPISLKNLSFGGCLISDQALICKKLLEHGSRPKIAFVTVVPRPFVDTTIIESISPVKCYFDHRHHGLDRVKNFSQLFDYFLDKSSNIYRTRSDYSTVLCSLACSIFDRPASSLSAKNANGLGSKNKVFLSGTEERLNANESANPAAIEFEKSKYKDFYKFEPALFNRQYDCFNQMLFSLKEKDVCTVVVKLPLDKVNLDIINPQILSMINNKVEQSAKKYDTTLIDLQRDSSFTSADYTDSVHLNASGSIKVWKKIGEYIKQDAKLSALMREKLQCK